MELAEFHAEATRVLSEIRKGNTFLTVHHYMNNYGEISDYSVCFHINYLNALKRSYEILINYKASDKDAKDKPYTLRDLQIAKKELLDSFELTLAGESQSTSAHAYSRVASPKDDLPIPGVKLHDGQDLLHIEGFKVHKRILLPGNYPKKNSAGKTIAKNDLRQLLPISKFCQFKLAPGKFYKLTVDGMTLTEDDVLREDPRLRLLVEFIGKTKTL